MSSVSDSTTGYCAYCGQSFASQVNFCTSCGRSAVLSTAMYDESLLPTCLSCGQTAVPDATFCGRCGRGLAATAPGIDPEALAQAVAEDEAGGTDDHWSDQATDAMGSVTTVLPSGDRGPTFPISLHATTVLGRTEGDANFDDQAMSPRHLEVKGSSSATLMAKDLGSLNGTFLRLREPATVGDGTRLLVGHQVLRLRRVEPRPPMLDVDGTVFRGSAARATTWALEQLASSGDVRDVFHLPPSGALLGREKGDLRFPLDTFVSTEHCRLELSEDKVVVTDLKSSNGTWLGLDTPVHLRDGEELLVGRTLLRFMLPSM